MTEPVQWEPSEWADEGWSADVNGIIADELKKIAVTADHHDLIPALDACQRAEDVISFEPLGAGSGDPVRLKYLQDHVHLRTEIVGDLLDV